MIKCAYRNVVCISLIHSIYERKECNMETKTFGQILTEARKKAGISQREAAKMIDVANSTWARWESDEICPKNLETLDKICGLLHLNLLNVIDLVYPDFKEKYNMEFEILKNLRKMNVQ